ncbi:MAG: type II toxin-antitoxin system HicB family antitoxin [Rubrobacter sp.]|nr:type II toxin-antitoxin system HicB family antitoxin [Rubrobacter sp.]
MQKRFTAVFEDTGDGWIAQVEQIPGTRTQGRTLEEVLCRMGEAAELILAALEEREEIRGTKKT